LPIVQYWPVGSAREATLTLNPANISNFLLADWLPDLPFSLSQSVIGWPQYLIEAETGTTNQYLYLNRIAGWSDRQWKSILSWMIGVAATRRVLKEEGYSYIAPCSAFYPERKQLVSIPSWLPAYPPSILEIKKNPAVNSRLRPDYIAAKFQTSNNCEFAFVESKGTLDSLRNKNTCPNDWRNQAKNAKAYINGVEATVSRNLVVAARCNPNKQRAKARRLQIRAWNSQTNDPSSDNRILVEIVLAHYVALLRNLGLLENIKALGLSALARLDTNSASRQAVVEANQRADFELSRILRWSASEGNDAHLVIRAENLSIDVGVAHPALLLIRNFRSIWNNSDINSMLNEYLILLHKWHTNRIQEYQENEKVSVDGSGFIVKIGMENQNEGQR
jgi:hypothetical protein